MTFAFCWPSSSDVFSIPTSQLACYLHIYGLKKVMWMYSAAETSSGRSWPSGIAIWLKAAQEFHQSAHHISLHPYVYFHVFRACHVSRIYALSLGVPRSVGLGCASFWLAIVLPDSLYNYLHSYASFQLFTIKGTSRILSIDTDLPCSVRLGDQLLFVPSFFQLFRCFSICYNPSFFQLSDRFSIRFSQTLRHF